MLFGVGWMKKYFCVVNGHKLYLPQKYIRPKFRQATTLLKNITSYNQAYGFWKQTKWKGMEGENLLRGIILAAHVWIQTPPAPAVLAARSLHWCDSTDQCSHHTLCSHGKEHKLIFKVYIETSFNFWVDVLIQD